MRATQYVHNALEGTTQSSFAQVNDTGWRMGFSTQVKSASARQDVRILGTNTLLVKATGKVLESSAYSGKTLTFPAEGPLCHQEAQRYKERHSDTARSFACHHMC